MRVFKQLSLWRLWGFPDSLLHLHSLIFSGTLCGSSSCRLTTRPWKWPRLPSQESPDRSRPSSSAWTLSLTPPSICFSPKTGWLLLSLSFAFFSRSLSLIHYFLPTPVIFIPLHCCLSCPCPCDSLCLNYSFMLGHYFRPFNVKFCAENFTYQISTLMNESIHEMALVFFLNWQYLIQISWLTILKEAFEPFSNKLFTFLFTLLSPFLWLHPCYKETNAIHVNVGAGSYLEVNIPMTVGENGKTSRPKCHHFSQSHVSLVKVQTLAVKRDTSA